MSDLIDRSKLPEIRISIPAYLIDYRCRSVIEIVSKGFQTLIESAPAVYAVEVVRCKDCVHYDNTPYDWIGSRYCECLGCYRQGDFFCAYGRKREVIRDE